MKKQYLNPAINLYECDEVFCADSTFSLKDALGADFDDNNWDELVPQD